MLVVITGASGLIGTALTKALLSRGDTVVHLVRRPTSPGLAQELRWDPTVEGGARVLLEIDAPIDAVVHLAGAPIADKRWSEARRKELVDSRVRSTRILVEAMGELDVAPGRFVSGSAIGIYGDRGDLILEEGAIPGSGFLADLCVAWEQAAAGAPSPTTLLRTGIVLTKDGGALKKQLPLFRAGLGGRLGAGTQYQSWISLDDEVAIISRLIDPALPAVPGPVNATAPEPVTNAAFTKSLATTLHRPAFAAVPPFALGIALGSDLAREVLLASQRVIPKNIVDAGFAFTHPNLDGALAAILEKPAS